VRRLDAADHADFADEFVAAVATVFPRALLQFEDFDNASAFGLLARHRDRTCCFNDDIQGTGAMALAGLCTSGRLTGRRLVDERILFVGAGEAGLGIGGLLEVALVRAGLDHDAVRARRLFFDSCGAVVTTRIDLPAHKRAFASDRPASRDLVAAIHDFRPTVLLGACARGGTFDEPVLRALAATCERPVVFALSNPTAQAECTAAQALAWTDGRAIFASGSPFPPVTVGGRTHAPGQANNAYVFPGVGLGVLVAGATRVTDAMFLAAADALAACVDEGDLAVGRIYPPQSRLRDVVARVATAVVAAAGGHAPEARQPDAVPPLPRRGEGAVAVANAMYVPAYVGEAG
jgi:malate dehydrogenase (oxaloacetate-decarboxylating)(NADP+)